MSKDITQAELRQINQEFRAKDDSHLWPICGAFNVTERAIRQARRIAQANGSFSSAYEYRETLHALSSAIVNDPKNQ